MKKFYIYVSTLALCAFANTIIAQEQLPNNGFENWKNVVVDDSLDYWVKVDQGYETNVNPISDGYSGDAVRMEALITEGDVSGGIILGVQDDDTGDFNPIPFVSTHVSEFNAYLRYDLMPDDTAQVHIYLYEGGTIYSYNVLPIYGTQPTWDLFTWDLGIHVESPDSILIAFFASNYGESEAIEGSWLDVDHVYFTDEDGTPTEIPNFEFENWTDKELEVTEEWNTLDPFLAGILNINNISKSTDAVEGTYSLKMESLEFNEESNVRPIAMIGEFDFEIEDFIGGMPYTSNPMLLKGQYKFDSEASDTAFAYLRFWKDEDTLQFEKDLFPVSDWTEFSFDIALDFTPDSVLFIVVGGVLEGAITHFDDIRFVYDDVSVSDNKKITSKIYPNPVNDVFHIDLSEEATIIVTDLLGKEMYNSIKTNSMYEISTSNWANGLYIVQIHKGNYVETQEVIIQH